MERGTAVSEIGRVCHARRRLILVADMGDLYRTLVREAARTDWEVVVVRDSDLRGSFESAADLAVIDVCPEGIPCLESIRALRVAAPHANIIAVTAYPSVSLVVAAMRAGAATCLAKPIHIADLARMMNGENDERMPPELVGLPSLGRVEWDYIARVLGDTGGNISKTAKILGIQRSTLQRKLRKYPPKT